VIKTFKHAGLRLFFSEGVLKGIPPHYSVRIERMLDRLDASVEPHDMNIPGYKFHALKGSRKGHYAVSVSGNWRLTFAFDGQDAVNVNLEDYH
jgi:proteic killer suppression protein